MPAFAVLAVALWAGPACAQVYAVTEANGTLVLSNFASGANAQLVVDAPPAPPVLPSSEAEAPPLNTFGRPPGWQAPPALLASSEMAARAQALQPIIETAAREQAISPQLLHAVIQVESGYQDRAVSPKGAMGLMQLMPQTARRFGVLNAFDARQNVQGGARYLRWLLDYFGGDLNLALAGYNAGEGAVVRAGYRVPPINETLNYVPRVLARLR